MFTVFIEHQLCSECSLGSVFTAVNRIAQMPALGLLPQGGSHNPHNKRAWQRQEMQVRTQETELPSAPMAAHSLPALPIPIAEQFFFIQRPVVQL